MTVRSTLTCLMMLNSFALCGGCEKSEPAVGKVAEGVSGAAGASAAAAATGQRGDVEIVAAPAGQEDVPSMVRRERARAEASGRRLLVYVGASWCEPCMRFHRAVLAGQVEGEMPKVTLLEFDKDRDDDRLKAAGYSSGLIPLFAVPAADGSASGKQMEGSIKGEGAVAEITPRLRRLLQGEGGR